MFTGKRERRIRTSDIYFIRYDHNRLNYFFWDSFDIISKVNYLFLLNVVKKKFKILLFFIIKNCEDPYVLKKKKKKSIQKNSGILGILKKKINKKL
jgi:hypothetical protein